MKKVSIRRELSGNSAHVFRASRMEQIFAMLPGYPLLARPGE